MLLYFIISEASSPYWDWGEMKINERYGAFYVSLIASSIAAAEKITLLFLSTMPTSSYSGTDGDHLTWYMIIIYD